MRYMFIVNKYTLVEKSLQVTVYRKAFFEEKLLCLGTKGFKGQYLWIQMYNLVPFLIPLSYHLLFSAS